MSSQLESASSTDSGDGVSCCGCVGAEIQTACLPCGCVCLCRACTDAAMAQSGRACPQCLGAVTASIDLDELVDGENAAAS